jgi:glutathione peroxidase
MGVIMDLYKKGNYVETPYNNFYEIKARDLNKNFIKMDSFERKILLVVNISPYDKNLENEFEKLLILKNSFKNENFEILAFPSAQIDNVEVSDREMKEKLLDLDIVKNNIQKIHLFNRVYLNGEETAEALKFCYRNSSLYMYREGKAKFLDKNFSKFLINNKGNVYAYYRPETDLDEIEKNIEYLISEKAEKIKIRHDYINFNKFY